MTVESTVYYTPTSSYAAPSSYSAKSSSSVYVAPSSSSSSSAYVAPTTSSSSVYVAPTTSSVYVAPTTAASSSSAPALTSAYSAPNKVVSSSTSGAAAATSASSYTGGKRGLAYNDVALTDAFSSNSKVGWAYNWGSSATGLASNIKFIPLLWGTASTWTSVWSANAKAAIASGSTHLFSFNEPDMSTQANLSPADAAAAYKTYMMPFAGQAKLCAPAVTNGGGAMGLDWLMAFIDECQGCQIDCVSIHWYSPLEYADDFKVHVQNATDVSGGKEVFVSEFAPTTGSDSDIASFLGDVMPWMDSQSFIGGYAYFMVADGMLNSGSSTSTIGSAYLA